MFVESVIMPFSSPTELDGAREYSSGVGMGAYLAWTRSSVFDVLSKEVLSEEDPEEDDVVDVVAGLVLVVVVEEEAAALASSGEAAKADMYWKERLRAGGKEGGRRLFFPSRETSDEAKPPLGCIPSLPPSPRGFPRLETGKRKSRAPQSKGSAGKG
jgi:hypothetical protein